MQDLSDSEVYLEYLEDSSGNTILSKEKADFMLRWRSLRKAYDEEEIILNEQNDEIEEASDNVSDWSETDEEEMSDWD